MKICFASPQYVLTGILSIIFSQSCQDLLWSLYIRVLYIICTCMYIQNNTFRAGQDFLRMFYDFSAACLLFASILLLLVIFFGSRQPALFIGSQAAISGEGRMYVVCWGKVLGWASLRSEKVSIIFNDLSINSVFFFETK